MVNTTKSHKIHRPQVYTFRFIPQFELVLSMIGLHDRMKLAKFPLWFSRVVKLARYLTVLDAGLSQRSLGFDTD
jgi:hypothetical protein